MAYTEDVEWERGEETDEKEKKQMRRRRYWMKCSVSPANHLITNGSTVWCCVVGGYSLVFKQNTEWPCLQYNLPILMYSTLYSQGIGGGGGGGGGVTDLHCYMMQVLATVVGCVLLQWIWINTVTPRPVRSFQYTEQTLQIFIWE